MGLFHRHEMNQDAGFIVRRLKPWVGKTGRIVQFHGCHCLFQLAESVLKRKPCRFIPNLEPASFNVDQWIS